MGTLSADERSPARRSGWAARGWRFAAAAGPAVAGVVALGGGPPGAAILAALTAAGGVLVATRALARRIDREFVEPLERIAAAAHGQERLDHLPEVGHHAVALVARRLNTLLMSALETNRQSRAQLMSVEAAFDRIHAVLHSLAEAVVVIDAGGNVVL